MLLHVSSAVALELSFASKGYMPPYISLDIPWRPVSKLHARAACCKQHAPWQVPDGLHVRQFRPFAPYPTLSMQHLARA